MVILIGLAPKKVIFVRFGLEVIFSAPLQNRKLQMPISDSAPGCISKNLTLRIFNSKETYLKNLNLIYNSF